MKKWKKLLAVCSAFFTVSTSFLAIPTTVHAADALAPFDAAARSAMSVDFETGKIFYARDAETVYPIASMTKLITAYIALDQVKKGNISWDDTIATSQYAHNLSVDWRVSGVPMELGREYTVKELYQASLIASANGAAVALAEKISGSEEKFVQKMNEQLEKWGIQGSHIINASGLPNELIPEGNRFPGSNAEDENKMSARGVATMAREILKSAPEILDTTRVATLPFGQGTASEVEMTNWNWMLPGLVFEYEGVDGLKTGTTTAAGQCFVGTAKRDDWRIITVIMHANNSDTNAFARFEATRALMDWTFENWSRQDVLEAGATFAAANSFPVRDGRQSHVPLELKDNVNMWVQKGADLRAVRVHYISPTGTVSAPVTAGEQIGKVRVSMEQDPNGYLDNSTNEYPMIAKVDVARNNFFVILFNRVVEYVSARFS